jgi:hypothetical protein
VSPQRCCQTCGRQLSSNNPNAKFCSEKELGAAAKKCRNAASNPRNNALRRQRRFIGQLQLFTNQELKFKPAKILGFALAAA